MTTLAMPRDQQIIRHTIVELLNTSKTDLDAHLSQSDIEWAINAWMTCYTSLSGYPELLYRGFALANRKSHIGRYAITFNRRLYASIRNQSGTAMFEVLKSPPFPELDDNRYLKTEEKSAIATSLNKEMLSLNLLFEKALRNPTIYEFIDSDTHKICKDNVCTILSQTDSTTFSHGPIPIVVFISEDKGLNIHTYSFNTLRLVDILLHKKVNPYTGEHFRDELLNRFRDQYHIEILLMARASEITDSIESKI